MEVREALTEAGVIGVTVTEVKGCGWQKGHSDIYRGAEYVVELLSKVKLELVVGDALCQVAVDTILEAVHIGKIGGGKVFVQGLESIIRTEGFNRLRPSLYCGVFLALSIHLLNLAVRNLGGRSLGRHRHAGHGGPRSADGHRRYRRAETGGRDPGSLNAISSKPGQGAAR